MSRSYAHKPKISWVIYKSNKKDRTLANKIFRAKSKNRLRNGKEPLQRLFQVQILLFKSALKLEHVTIHFSMLQ